MRRTQILILFVTGLGLFLVQTPDSLAAKKIARKVQPETYSATEPGIVTITTTTAVPVGSAALATDESAPVEETEETELPPVPATAAAPAAAPASTFDPVPSDQASLIAKRLPLIEKIMVKHGRAYDYRAHTVKQLEAILASLDQSEATQP